MIKSRSGERMNLGDLAFTADELSRDYGPLGKRAQMASQLNEILRAKLEKAPKYFGGVDENGMCVSPFGMLPARDDTHTARLVCIEEVGR